MTIHVSSSEPPPAADRCQLLARRWSVSVDNAFETTTSLIAYGTRDGSPVVLKIVAKPGDEWQSGEVVAAFGGHRFIRVLEYTDGALLLERLDPGTSLAELSVAGDDDEATVLLADLIGGLVPREAPAWCPTVEAWGRAFQRHLEKANAQISLSLVRDAADVYAELCASQRRPRLLHGDLQHYNVLFDRQRGWVAIDPKGVIGEPEYEIGALMRNPTEMPELLTDPTVIRRRLDQLCSRLGLDPTRATAWTFAQAVLSVIWEIEDGNDVSPSNASLALARAVRPML